MLFCLSLHWDALKINELWYPCNECNVFSKVEKIVMEYKINRDIPSKDISKITGLGLKTIDNAYERIKKKVKNSEEIKEYLARQ